MLLILIINQLKYFRNLDYKYEGREKLPMQKHQQNPRPYQNHEHRREGNEERFHHNHRQRKEDYHDGSESHDVEHRREHHGQGYRNHRHNNRDRDHSAGYDVRDMHHPQYPAESYDRYHYRPDSRQPRDYHPPAGNRHHSRDQQNRTRGAERYQNFSDRRRFNNRADYDEDWKQSHIEIHDDHAGHDSERCLNPKNQQQWTNSRSTFRQGYRNGYNDESHEYYEQNGRIRGQYQGDKSYRKQRSVPYGSRSNRPYHRHSENQLQRSSGVHDSSETNRENS